MSVLKIVDSNTVLAPITICIAGKKYIVKNIYSYEMYKFKVIDFHGQLWFCNGEEKVLPLVPKTT